MRAVGGAPIQELATLLACGYLRLLAARRQAELAPLAPGLEEGSRNPQIPLDVAGPAKRQLDRGVHP